MTDAKMQLQLRLHEMIDGLREKARIHHAVADEFEQQAANAERSLRTWLHYERTPARILPSAVPVDLSEPRDAEHKPLQVEDVYRVIAELQRPVTYADLKQRFGSRVGRALTWWVQQNRLVVGQNASDAVTYDIPASVVGV